MAITKGKPIASTMSPGGWHVNERTRAGHVHPKKSIINALLLFINAVERIHWGLHVALLQIHLKIRCSRNSKNSAIGMIASYPAIHGVTTDFGNTISFTGIRWAPIYA